MEHFYQSEEYRLEGFQKLVVRYKTVSDEAILSEIKEKISYYVRYYPSFAFRVFDEDILSDFYMIVFSKLDAIIKNYDLDKKVAFKTYLSQSLKNTWINFLLERKKQLNEITHGLEFEDLAVEQKTVETVSNGFFESFFKNEKDDFRYLAIKLYYHDFFNEEDFIQLTKFTKKSYGTCLVLYKKLLDNVAERRARRNWYEAMLTKTQMTIIRRRDLLEDKKYERLREISQKYLKLYRNVQEFPSFQVIADFFDCEPVKISNAVHYFKKQIKKNKEITEYIK